VKQPEEESKEPVMSPFSNTLVEQRLKTIIEQVFTLNGQIQWFNSDIRADE